MINYKNKYTLFFTVLVLNLLIVTVLNAVGNHFYPNTYDHITDIGQTSDPSELFSLFVKAIIIAPFLETLIFQCVIIEIVKRMKGKDALAILISSLLFSVAHNHSVVYILLIIPSAVIMATYYTYLRKNSITLAFLSVSLIHMCHNIVAYFINYPTNS